MAVKLPSKRHPWQLFKGPSLKELMRRAEKRFHGWYQIDTAGCWIWSGRRYPSGYGYMNVGQTNIGAHRLSWRLMRGPIPEGLFVLHKCDVMACCNPNHMFIGTQKANMQDKIAKGRQPDMSRSICKNGHPFTEANTGRTKQGHKVCRRCSSDTQLRYKARNIDAVRKYQRERLMRIRHENKGATECPQ